MSEKYELPPDAVLSQGEEWAWKHAIVKEFIKEALSRGFKDGRQSMLAERDAAIAERDEARRAIAWANNSLFGSHAFFLSLHGGPPNEHHLDTAIENLKELGRETFKCHARAEAAEAQVAKLREAAAPFVAHYTPAMDGHPDTAVCWSYPIMSMGDVRKLRAALEPAHD